MTSLECASRWGSGQSISETRAVNLQAAPGGHWAREVKKLTSIRSRSALHHRARPASGGWPALPGKIVYLLGLSERFRVRVTLYPILLSHASPGTHLARRCLEPRKRPSVTVSGTTIAESLDVFHIFPGKPHKNTLGVGFPAAVRARLPMATDSN